MKNFVLAMLLLLCGCGATKQPSTYNQVPTTPISQPTLTSIELAFTDGGDFCPSTTSNLCNVELIGASPIQAQAIALDQAGFPLIVQPVFVWNVSPENSEEVYFNPVAACPYGFGQYPPGFPNAGTGTTLLTVGDCGYIVPVSVGTVSVTVTAQGSTGNTVTSNQGIVIVQN
jgi:hypothetical protein